MLRNTAQTSMSTPLLHRGIAGRRMKRQILHLELLESRRLLSGVIISDYGHTPLSFEQNLGQLDSRADFLARGGGYSLFLSDGCTSTL